MRDKKLIILIIIITLVTGLATFLLVLEISQTGKIYPGIKVAGINLGGLTPSQAQNILERKINIFSQTGITFSTSDRKWKASLEELGLSSDLAKSISQASQIGRGYNLFKNWFEQIKTCLIGYQLNLSWQLNKEKFRDYLTQRLRVIEDSVQETSLFFEDNDFKVISSQAGFKINQALLRVEFQKKITSLSRDEIKIELIKVYPEIEAEEVIEAREKALAILAKPTILKYENQTWEISPEQILSWIEFKSVKGEQIESTTTFLHRVLNFSVSHLPLDLLGQEDKNKILGLELSQDSIKDYLIQITPEINQEAVNAELTVKGGRVVVFTLDQSGIQLKIEESVAKIIQDIINNQSEITLEVTKEEPEVTIENINNLGITALISQGTSNFSGSPKNRRHNISVGATRFHGVLVKPGEEFSFNQTLGEVGPQQGYLAELVIKHNETVPEYGGGLCQVSTTAFRAALYAGVPITERYPPAYPVAYYNPQGMDATIYPPHPDLRFINDTPGHLLIQTKVAGNILTFYFYGTDDSREVKIKGPYQYDIKP
ncbi:MAG TPA: hypothetical protein ENI16_00725, partial [Candidatus Portnoybacteria bacterium]|nr:hypothetical protein [Candidatus Portnoybacteria bacterium]